MKRVPYKKLILHAFSEHTALSVRLLVDALDTIFVSKSESYRRLRRSLFGYDDWILPARAVSSRFVSENAIRVTLSRLKKEGLVESRARGSWTLTKTARLKLHQNRSDASTRAESRVGGRGKIVVAFDIPEYDRHHRRWIRHALRNAEFVAFQKSVWMGDRPLPEEFFRELVRRNLEQCVSILGIGSPGTTPDIRKKLR